MPRQGAASRARGGDRFSHRGSRAANRFHSDAADLLLALDRQASARSIARLRIILAELDLQHLFPAPDEAVEQQGPSAQGAAEIELDVLVEFADRGTQFADG